MPFMKTTKTIIIEEIAWYLIYPLIEKFIKEKYNKEFPPNTRVRVLNKSGGMINPDRIQFKYTEEE
jgi:hypothetical protein